MPEEILETPQATQPTEPKPINWPKIILVAVLGFGLLASAAYAGYWYGTESVKDQSMGLHLKTQVPEAAPAEVPPTETHSISCPDNAWCSLRNDTYGYELQFPPEWSVSWESWGVAKLSSGENTISIFPFQKVFGLTRNVDRKELPPFSEEKDSVQIGDYTTEKTRWLEGEKVLQEHAFLDIEDNAFTFLLEDWANGISKETSNIFNRILSTFKFLD